MDRSLRKSWTLRQSTCLARILVCTSHAWVTTYKAQSIYMKHTFFRDFCGTLWAVSKSVFVVSSVRWRAVWICSERWTIMPEGGGWGWLCGSCQNPQAVMIICQDLLCNKKAYPTGSISVSISVSAFLLIGFAYCVCCVHTVLIFSCSVTYCIC